jgi:hypothetical protein
MRLHEIKNFHTTKEMVSKLKRPPTEWEKIFASYNLANKGLITRIYRKLKKLNSQKINDPIRNEQMNCIEPSQRKQSKWLKST